MRKITFLLLLKLSALVFTAQSNDITLRFTSEFMCSYAPLDSIVIKNSSRDVSTVLYYPDTVLIISATDIDILDGNYDELYVSQNYPNPFSSKTYIDVGVPEKDNFIINVYDLTGRKLATHETELKPGLHHFTFHACEQQSYILTVNSNKYSQKILMLQTGKGGSYSRIEYSGTSSQAKSQHLPQTKELLLSDFYFMEGDELMFTGFIAGEHQSIFDFPSFGYEYIHYFDIANAIPDMPSDIFGDQAVLAGQTGLVYEVDEKFGITYEWQLPGGWEITDGHGKHSITATAGNNSGNISIRAKNDCGTSYDNFLSVTVQFSLDLEADPEEGGEVDGEGIYDHWENIWITATPNQGYEFENWTDEYNNVVSLSNEFSFSMPNKHTTLTANFTLANYQLNLLANPIHGGGVEGAGLYNLNDVVTINAIPEPGYGFANWTGDTEYVDDAEASTATVTMPANDISITANFEPVYNLMFAANPEDAGFFEGEGEYFEGEEVNITAIPNHFFFFQSWEATAGIIDDPNAASTTFTMPGEDVTITGNFEINPEQENTFDFVVFTHPGKMEYQFVVDNADNLAVLWQEDSVVVYNGSVKPTHAFEQSGYHTIKVKGYAERLAFFTPDSWPWDCDYAPMLRDILTPVSDGVEGITSAQRMFRDAQVESFTCAEFFDAASENVTTLLEMFKNTHFNQNLNNWNVSNVTDMYGVFLNSDFNSNISDWDVSSVSTMRAMFENTPFNQDIGAWNVKNVINMRTMFLNSDFNQDIGGWNVGNVTNMYGMFNGATSFNQNIGGWDVSEVTNMGVMFGNASSFNQNISGWDVSNVTNMSGIFQYATSFNQDIGGWEVGNVTDMSYMFMGLWEHGSSFNQDISTWDVSNVGDFNNFLLSNKLSKEYYNNLLIEWSYLDLQQDVTFHGGDSRYDIGEPEDRRQHIIDEFGWTIIDGGKVEFMLNIVANPEGAATFEGEGSYHETQVVDITAIANPFFEFNSWETPVDGTIDDVSSHETIFTMPGKDVTLTANFTEKEPEAGFFQFSVKTTSDKTDYEFIVEGAEDLLVIWNEGNEDTYNGNVIPSFNFEEEGEWVIKMQGTASRIAFSRSGYANMLTGITPLSEGITGVTSTKEMFRNTNVGDFWHPEFLDDIAGNITDMSGMFPNTPFNKDISHWDVSNVEDMSAMFSGTPFNREIGAWIVSNVKDMSWMFYDSDFNQNIGEWNVSNVTDMEFMFCRASAFNQSIDGWDVGNVTSMRQMFQDSDFNQDIGSWNVSNVTNMFGMFENSPFNQDIGGWNVENVTNMEWMFRNTPFNHNISLWIVSNVTNMQQMFQNSDFNQNISSWDVSNVTNMRSMFSVTPFNQDISAWNVSNVTNMISMFSATPFNQDISAWNVSNVSDMSYMFRNSGFNQDISSWDVSWVTTMAFMFDGTPFNQDISNWDVRKVTDMSSMFRNSDFDQNISDWNVSNVGTFPSFLDGAKLSTDNYNSLLISWSQQELQGFVSFTGGKSMYDEGLPAERRDSIIEKFNWNITDGGITGIDYTLINLDMISSPEEAGRLFGRGDYQENEEVQISAVANPMYKFTHWTTTGGTITDPNEPDTTITMPGEHVTVTAYFEENPEETNTFDFVVETTAEQTEYKFEINNAQRIFIHWREGHIEEYSGEEVLASHNFEQAGTWTVRVLGKASRIAFYSNPDWEVSCKYAPMLRDILTPVSDGVEGITSAYRMFRETEVVSFTCNEFFDEASANVTNMQDIFYNATSFNHDISKWDVSNVTNMSGMFYNTAFNQDIGGWDVRKVTDMSSMFRNSDFDQNISEWDVSSVTNMRNMFTSTPFNQDIGSWIVSNVTDMSEMFENASSFDQDISGWIVSNVTHMSWMFRNTEFNRNIGSWDVSNVINMKGMLSNTPFDQDISGWDISKVWNFEFFLSGSKLSTDNYNNLLIEWSKLELVTGRAFHAGFSKYDLGEPADRRQYIIDHFGWTIYDGGCWCVTDVDNNTYPTVMINGMEWMAENLRVTKYSDDTSIPSGLSSTDWSTQYNNEEGAVAVYNHAEVDGINSEVAMAIAYGRLYNWYAVVDARGLCPAGWRMPTNDDWSDMADYLMTEHDLTNDETDPNAVGNALKSCRHVNSPLGGECATEEHPRWNESATHYGTDDFGFSGLPAGNRFPVGYYSNILTDAYWWTITEDTEETYDEAFLRALYIDEGSLHYGPSHKGNGLSVRCVRDN